MARRAGRRFGVWAAGLAAAVVAGWAAQPRRVAAAGIFAGSTDIGAALPGTTVFDAASSTYRVSGGGADLWGTADAFHFDWQELNGDATLTADVEFPPGEHPPNEKAVLMFRQSLDPASMYADVAIHADGDITLQWRDVLGGQTDDAEAEQHRSKTLRIERRGDVYEGYAAGSDGKLRKFASAVIALHDPLYVGLGVCAHDAKGTATVTFAHVEIRGARLGPEPAQTEGPAERPTSSAAVP
jgi:TolB protein